MEISAAYIVLVPVVVGVVQVCKRAGLSSRLAPFISLVFGVLGVYLLGGLNHLNILQGIIIGLSAAGLWSGTKATVATKKK